MERDQQADQSDRFGVRPDVPSEYLLPSHLEATAAAARLALGRHELSRTPLILLDRAALRGQIALWRTHLPHVEPHFAVKVNDFAPLIEFMRDEGMSFDAATGGEINHLQSLRVRPERVVVTHPIRDALDLIAINRFRPKSLVVQDAAELHKFAEAGIPNAAYAPELLVRIKFEFSNLNKFGLEGVFYPHQRADGTSTWSIDHRPLVELFKAAREVERHRGVPFSGFGFAGHVGTNSTSVNHYQMMLSVFRLLHERLARLDIPIVIFDIGGGYCDPEVAAANGTTQDRLLREIGGVTRDAADACPGVRLIAEPGRFMVSHCAALLTGVRSAHRKKWRVGKNGGVEWIDHQVVHMDDSIYGTLLGQAHDDKRWQFYALRPGDGETNLSAELMPTLIWGSTCDSWDKITGDRLLPCDIRAGDSLIVPHVGAYATATKTSFNRAVQASVFFYERTPSGETVWTLYDQNGDEIQGHRDAGDAILRPPGASLTPPTERTSAVDDPPMTATPLHGNPAHSVRIGPSPESSVTLTRLGHFGAPLNLSDYRPRVLDDDEVKADSPGAPALDNNPLTSRELPAPADVGHAGLLDRCRRILAVWRRR